MNASPTKQFPAIPLELLTELEKLYPDRMPSHNLGLEDIRFQQGQVCVVRLLRRNFDKQNTTVLHGR